MRKPIIPVSLIKAALSGQPLPPTPPAGGAALPPTFSEHHRGERRTDRILHLGAHRNRGEAQLVEFLDTRPDFLPDTKLYICDRFLRGRREAQIANEIGGLRRGVCRQDVEDVIRNGYLAERDRRIAAERELRRKAA